jgi:hypothetical protein
MKTPTQTNERNPIMEVDDHVESHRKVPHEVHRHAGADSSAASSTDAPREWTELTAHALERVRESVQNSLREAPPDIVALDTSAALFHKLLYRLDAAVDEALQCTQQPIERIDGLARAIDLMLRIARQIDRFGHLRRLLLDAQRSLPSSDSP